MDMIYIFRNNNKGIFMRGKKNNNKIFKEGKTKVIYEKKWVAV